MFEVLLKSPIIILILYKTRLRAMKKQLMFIPKLLNGIILNAVAIRKRSI